MRADLEGAGAHVMPVSSTRSQQSKDLLANVPDVHRQLVANCAAVTAYHGAFRLFGDSASNDQAIGEWNSLENWRFAWGTQLDDYLQVQTHERILAAPRLARGWSSPTPPSRSAQDVGRPVASRAFPGRMPPKPRLVVVTAVHQGHSESTRRTSIPACRFGVSRSPTGSGGLDGQMC
jgi:hypothetical protein